MQFPLFVRSKFLTLMNEWTIYDDNYNEVFYFTKERFKPRERIQIYNDKTKKKLMYEMNARKIIDFDGEYPITNFKGELVGTVERDGYESLINTQYVIYNSSGQRRIIVKRNYSWRDYIDIALEAIPIPGLLDLLPIDFLRSKYMIVTHEAQHVIDILPTYRNLRQGFEIDMLDDLDAEDLELAMIGLIALMVIR